MKPFDFARYENWALSVISLVRGGSRVEDTRVELKAEWPAPENAARRLAGRANAALGSDVLWLIGVDESRGVVGADRGELSEWWSQVQSQFDGIAPSLTDLILNVDGLAVRALVFDSSRAPFVVKNPMYGKAGSVSLEVPWREGTSVRTASRNDLIRLLVPIASSPEVEMLGGKLSLQNSHTGSQYKYLTLEVEIYLTPRGDAPTVFPFHRCWCSISAAEPASGQTRFAIRTEPCHDIWGTGSGSVMLEHSSSELVAHGPGKCVISLGSSSREIPSWLTFDLELDVSIHLEIVGGPRPILLEARAEPVGSLNTWRFRPRRRTTA